MNMINCGRKNVRKHTDITNGEKYITLHISLKFGSLDKIKITSSDKNNYLGRSVKFLITYLVLKKHKIQCMALLISV